MNGPAQPRHVPLPPLPPQQPPQHAQSTPQPLPRMSNGPPSLRMSMAHSPLPAFAHGRSPPNLDNTKHVPCKFFPLGTCNAGDACKFSHNLETAQDRQPCKYFQKGNCKFGAKCALLHIIDGRPVNDPAGQQGFPRQVVIGGPQISGLSSGLMGMQIGSNQPPPPPTYQNGFQPPSYFSPTSPSVNDGHFQLSSQHSSPPSPPKYRSGLSSALQNHEIESEVPKSSSFNLLGPLDANFPSSVDLSNNLIARQGPFAASVPSKFGLLSGISSLAGSVRERVVTGDYPGSGTHSPVHGEFASRYGSPLESNAWPHDSFQRPGTLLQSIQQQRSNHPTSPLHPRPQSSSSPYTNHDQKSGLPSRLSQLGRSRLTPISSSVPAAHFGEKGLFSPIAKEDEEALDHDVLPSSLHDEVLLPQELNRRSSQSHTPGLNRRSSAYDDFARSPPSGAVTPGSERGGSLAGSPGSSRMEPIWAKIIDDQRNGDADGPVLSSRQRVSSPLRHPLDPMMTPSTTPYSRTRMEHVHLPSALKTPSVHAAQKWAGRPVEKTVTYQTSSDGGESQGVNVPGVVWRRTGEIIGTSRDELTNEEVRRIQEEEEGPQFSME